MYLLYVRTIKNLSIALARAGSLMRVQKDSILQDSFLFIYLFFKSNLFGTSSAFLPLIFTYTHTYRRCPERGKRMISIKRKKKERKKKRRYSESIRFNLLSSPINDSRLLTLNR